MNVYDVVIIGAGISGLYSAYKIQNINPNIKLVILEEQSEKYMGGRTGNEIFEGVKIVNGADVGRIGKDKVFAIIGALGTADNPILKIPIFAMYYLITKWMTIFI